MVRHKTSENHGLGLGDDTASYSIWSDIKRQKTMVVSITVINYSSKLTVVCTKNNMQIGENNLVTMYAVPVPQKNYPVEE